MIPAESYKSAGPVDLDTFHDLFCSIWEEKDMLQEFTDATIVSLYIWCTSSSTAWFPASPRIYQKPSVASI